MHFISNTKCNQFIIVSRKLQCTLPSYTKVIKDTFLYLRQKIHRLLCLTKGTGIWIKMTSISYLFLSSNNYPKFWECLLNPLYTEKTLPHYILEESNFNFRYIRLWDLHIPREKWLNYLQTVETLIRRRILRRLIWVCTVCQLPFYGSPNYNGLI